MMTETEIQIKEPVKLILTNFGCKFRDNFLPEGLKIRFELLKIVVAVPEILASIDTDFLSIEEIL